jgi:hypothetical protein
VEQGEGRPGGCGRRRKEGEPGKAAREAGSTKEDRGDDDWRKRAAVAGIV